MNNNSYKYIIRLTGLVIFIYIFGWAAASLRNPPPVPEPSPPPTLLLELKEKNTLVLCSPLFRFAVAIRLICSSIFPYQSEFVSSYPFIGFFLEDCLCFGFIDLVKIRTETLKFGKWEVLNPNPNGYQRWKRSSC